MEYETQRMDLSLKPHFKKMGYETQRVDLSLKEHFKNGIWNSKDGFESQNTFKKIGYETQRQDLSPKEHFKTCDINLTHCIWDSNDIFNNVISTTSFESPPTLFKICYIFCI